MDVLTSERNVEFTACVGMVAEQLRTTLVVQIQPECAMKFDGMAVQVNLICAKSVCVCREIEEWLRKLLKSFSGKSKIQFGADFGAHFSFNPNILSDCSPSRVLVHLNDEKSLTLTLPVLIASKDSALRHESFQFGALASKASKSLSK